MGQRRVLGSKPVSARTLLPSLSMRVTERRAPHVPASSLLQKSTRQYDPCKKGRRADALEDMDQSVHPPELDDVSTYDAGRKTIISQQSTTEKRGARHTL